MLDLTLNADLRQRVKTNLSQFEARDILDKNKKRASVALLLSNCHLPADIANIRFDANACEQAAYILTTRSSRLNNHRGQRAFPGGRIDEGESAQQAALRETQEEIGLQLNAEHVLGRLDDYATRSGYIITPYVLWAGLAPQLQANPDEVEAIHRVPLSELLRNDAPILESLTESEHPVIKMPLGDEWFAAPSAAIAYQFREVALLGRSTRVAHFEQPYFAWQ